MTNTMSETYELGFTKKHELNFIENIGLDKFGSMVLSSRKALIVKYIRAAENRTDWVGMDKDIILSAARKSLIEVV